MDLQINGRIIIINDKMGISRFLTIIIIKVRINT